jgi:hypothetical protein
MPAIRTTARDHTNIFFQFQRSLVAINNATVPRNNEERKMPEPIVIVYTNCEL